MDSDKFTFNSTAGELPGSSPFREVQVLIDGQLVGVVWPFPVIFTGGVVPSLHRPIAGIHAFDLREGEVDISPWIGELKAGERKVEIRVAGIDEDGEVTEKGLGEHWVVTGKVFLWFGEDGDGEKMKGKASVDAPKPAVTLERQVGLDKNGTANETLRYSTEVRRSILVKTGDGKITWSQELKYSNKGYLSGYGYNQINDVRIEGVDAASSGYEARYVYPLYVNSSYTVSPRGNLSISAYMMQGKEVAVKGRGVFPTGLEAFTGNGKKYAGSALRTRKDGTAEFRQTGDGMTSWGWGDSTQNFIFEGTVEGGGSPEELYWRNVSAVNGTLAYDWKRLGGEKIPGVGGNGYGTAQEGKPVKEVDSSDVFAEVLAEGGGHGAMRVFMGRNEPDKEV